MKDTSQDAQRVDTGFLAVAIMPRAICHVPPSVALEPCCLSPGNREENGLSANLKRNHGEKAELCRDYSGCVALGSLIAAQKQGKWRGKQAPAPLLAAP